MPVPTLHLAIENRSKATTRANLRTEVVSPSGTVCGTGSATQSLIHGRSVVDVPLPNCSIDFADQSKGGLWYRLKYAVTPADGSQWQPTEGTISVSQIAPDLFSLLSASSQYSHPGSAFAIRIQAQQPITHRSQPDVEITARLKFDDETTPFELTQRAVTDSLGNALLKFDIPATLSSDSADLVVTGHRGRVSSRLTTSVNIFRLGATYLSTDKPLYQPGQTLHCRILAVGDENRPIAGLKFGLTISNPEDTTVMRTELTTSEFGIASADWTIPQDERLGEYTIDAKPDDDEMENQWRASCNVKISRYELPTFAVSVTPDRAYYLPGQMATVEVRADYLFGKSVASGQVKIVEEEARSWNYKEQKWDISEGERYEGPTDSRGEFLAKIDLSKAQQDLASNRYQRFSDRTFSANFTDASTGKTEQRRFALRATKEPIHVYMIEPWSGQSEHLPLYFYLSAYYADGTPAQCGIAIRPLSVSDEGDHPRSRPLGVLSRVHTNRYGLAKVEKIRWPFHDDNDDWHMLRFEAKDQSGLTGTLDQGLRDNDDLLRVESDHSIEQPGRPLILKLTASRKLSTAVVQIYSDSNLLASRLIQLNGRRAKVQFDYEPDFRGRVSVVAYGLDSAGGRLYGGLTVVYPSPDQFKLTTSLSKDEYRPGEEVNATIRTEPGGVAALGLNVIDTSVEERARTDQDFKSGSQGFYGRLEHGFDGDQTISGVSLNEIEHLDPSKPLPEGLDLVAQLMLLNVGYVPLSFNDSDDGSLLSQLFSREINASMRPVKSALAGRFLWTMDYPKNEKNLNEMLRDAGLNFADVRDPWGDAYRADFSVAGTEQILSIKSAGPDKKFDTGDDIEAANLKWPYFKRYGVAIDRAVKTFHARTAGFIRDSATLRQELKTEGLDFDSLLDPWGHTYVPRFRIDQGRFVLDVFSHGPTWNGVASSGDRRGEISVWSNSIEYFAETRQRISSALHSRESSLGKIPDSEEDLQSFLQASGINAEDLVDPWGHAYYPVFSLLNRYSDHVTIEDRAAYGQKPVPHIEVEPVTQLVRYITLRSAGEDGKVGTSDDFSVAIFSAVVSERSASDPDAKKPKVIAPVSAPLGGVAGVVTDQNGAVIPNVTVTARNPTAALEQSTTSGQDGSYALLNLQPGIYSLEFRAPGFKSLIDEEVNVLPSKITQLDAGLSVGARTELVTVSAEGISEFTENASISETVSRPGPRATAKPGITHQAIQSPRLRQYFPETLFWAPEVHTDSDGSAQIRFKLADNITTWKMSVIASTKDGHIALLDKTIRSFQPFFVEHEPPRILTVGDEISLPVVLRNYLTRSQTVQVSMKPDAWFYLRSAPSQTLSVDSGGSSRALFDFVTRSAVADGKQRVTALGTDQSDAIEKPVTVHPDGRQIFESNTQIFDNGAQFDLPIPPDAITGSSSVSLKLYPNLTSHVLESIEGIMQRPDGCAEQTISASYASLLGLSLLSDNPEAPAPVVEKARRYLRLGYDRLLGYQDNSGGFTYWGRGAPDIALSAYALRFLNDASLYIDVDPEVINDTQNYLRQKQHKDGSWTVYDWNGKLDPAASLSTTAYVATVLARNSRDHAGSSKPTTGNRLGPKPRTNPEPALEKALDYLSQKTGEMDEPYMIACYALAEFDAGHADRAYRAVVRLASLARREGDTAYWALETNTPFFGWGLPGRIEASAMTVRALARAEQTGSALSANGGQALDKTRLHDLISSGLLFLLKQKDRYGVWYSTQATVDVLDALLTQIRPRTEGDVDSVAGSDPQKLRGLSRAPQNQTLDIYVNGTKSGAVTASSNDFYENPITVDLSHFVHTGENRVELKWAGGSSHATAQIVGSYYQPWSDFNSSESTRDSSRALELAVTFDKTKARVDDEIACTVKAERVGSHGYGMLIGEIGLPPGAEVDRDSMDKSIDRAGWSIDQYDILPDRLLVYLWPKAGGTTFHFKFRVRYGINAQTPASVLYDYYNPEAEAIQAPTRFTVSQR